MDPERARFNMIEQQIRPWNVLDQTVLDTFWFLPREKFVPASWAPLAFADTEIPLEYGEFMMQPKVEARMLQALAIRPTDHCLEIGTGSGFVTACMAHLGQHVDSIELYSDLSKQAEDRLVALNMTNISLYVDDANQGWSGNPDKQYDVIAVTGSISEYIPAFEQRLATDGRLFLVTGDYPAMKANLITRDDEGGFRCEVVFETVLKPLCGAEKLMTFSF